MENANRYENGEYLLSKIQRKKKLLFKRKRHKALSLISMLLYILALLGFCTFIYARWIEPTWIDVKSVGIKRPHLASEFNGYKIVQISDIHIDKTLPEKHHVLQPSTKPTSSYQDGTVEYLIQIFQGGESWSNPLFPQIQQYLLTKV